MKVFLLSGASSIHTIRWANGLAGADVEVTLVSQHRPIEKLDPRVIFKKLPHLYGLGYFLNGPRLSKLISECRPDVVNVHYASGYGTLGRWIKHLPYVLSVWGSDVYDFPYKSPLHRHILIGNLKKADVIASTSHAMADHVRSICPDITEIAITPFGVDTERFHPAHQNLQRDKVIIGTVKVLAPKYGIDTLLYAYRKLLDKMQVANHQCDFELRIVGDGPQKPELESLANRLQIADTTVFTGRISHENIPNELRNFDIFCALSRLDSESFGVAVIEASACGVPVVVSEAGGLPEVVLESQTGYIVPRNDPVAAAVAIEKLVHSPDLRRKMSRQGAEHVKKEYEWSECVRRMKALLEESINV